MTNLPISFLGLKIVKKGVSIAFETKMTQIVILDQKLIFPNDYQIPGKSKRIISGIKPRASLLGSI